MGDRLTPHEALLEASKRAGSHSALARICGVSQPAVSGWVRRGKGLPTEHAITVETTTGVSRYDSRPDIYPRDDRPADTGAFGDMEPAR